MVTYRVAINGKDIPVLRLFSAEGFGYKKSPISYVHALTEEPATIRVSVDTPIQSFQTTPHTNNIESSETELRLTLLPYAKQCLRINDGEWLFLFIDSPDKARPDFQSPDTLSIDRYGIDKTGVHLGTEKLQRAIDDAAALGRPATVYLSPGIYRTGSIWMKSNVTLYLDAGAMLLGDENDTSYPQRHYTSQDCWPAGTDPKVYASLIWFESVRNASIRGRGIIDGQGSRRRDLWRASEGRERHPTNNIRIVDSQEINIEGVVIRDSEFWAIHLLRSCNLNLRNLKVVNEMIYKGWDIRNPDSNWNNTDGIDPDSCSNVLVEDVFVYTGDDCLVLKTTNSSPRQSPSCENIIFRRCLLAASTAAIKFGTESVGAAIRNITFEDVVILSMNTGRNIGFVAKDVALIEDITFRNIRIENSEIWLSVGIQGRVPDQEKFVQMRDLAFENIELQAEPKGRLVGQKNTNSLSNLRFSNVRLAGRQVTKLEELGLTISDATDVIIESGVIQ